MKVLFFVNTHREDAIAAARKAAEFLASRAQVTIEQNSDDSLSHLAKTTAFDDAALAVTFGGDGTLIRAAHACAEFNIPILGVYYGRFGFVTQCLPDQLDQALNDFIAGELAIEDRMMVSSKLIRGDEIVTTQHALNEIAVQRKATTKMLDFEISVDGEFLTQYPADGIVVSTPTGSTAYNLSNGGPIVDPTLSVITVSAIAPHTLNARALVFPGTSEVSIKVRTRGDIVLSADGRSTMEMLNGDEIRVSKSPRTTRLVTVEKIDFLTKVRERLLWPRNPHELDDEDDL